MNRAPARPRGSRSAFLEMELDHDTGAMRGRILAGRMEGVTLDAPRRCRRWCRCCRKSTRKAARLLMAYLDRREPAWRENADAGATAGPAHVDRGKMTEEEAYQVLGVEPGASAADIGRAHRGADEETASRPRRVDVPRGASQRGQRPSSATTSLITPNATTLQTLQRQFVVRLQIQF